MLNNISKWLSGLGYSYHLPGLGISEPLGTPYSSGRIPSAVYAASAQNADPINYSSSSPQYYGGPNMSTNNLNWNPPNQGGSTGGWNPGDVIPTGYQNVNGQLKPMDINAQVSSNADLARQQAQHQYDYLRGQISNQQNDLSNTKNSLLDQLSTMYGNSIQQAKDTLASNLNTLNTAQNTVTTGYEGQKTDQGRLLGDVQRQNRQLARSMGDLGSSFYEGLQGNAASQTAQNITNFSNQEQSQLDQIANQITSENTTTNTKVQNLNDLETQAKNDVINRYQSSYNDIQNELARAGVDNTDAMNAINNQMQSTLNNISYLMSGYKDSVTSGAQSNTNIANMLQNLNTGTQNTLNTAGTVNTGFTPLNNAQTIAAAQTDAASLASQGYTQDQIIGQIQTQYPGLNNNTLQQIMSALYPTGTNLSSFNAISNQFGNATPAFSSSFYPSVA